MAFSRSIAKPILIPDGITATLDNGRIYISKGNDTRYEYQYPANMLSLVLNNCDLAISCENKKYSMIAGTHYANIANLIRGVAAGFSKILEVIGVGYKASIADECLLLALGFSHPVMYHIPEGILITTPSPTSIVISGISKHQVGMVAADICKIRKYDRYGGKGVVEKGKFAIRRSSSKK